jgi:hypothetical protein
MVPNILSAFLHLLIVQAFRLRDSTDIANHNKKDATKEIAPTWFEIVECVKHERMNSSVSNLTLPLSKSVLTIMDFVIDIAMM